MHMYYLQLATARGGTLADCVPARATGAAVTRAQGSECCSAVLANHSKMEYVAGVCRVPAGRRVTQAHSSRAATPTADCLTSWRRRALGAVHFEKTDLNRMPGRRAAAI
ncbi:jg20114 [Pararge aegeria aegeria]|uniref:Jg20114 protein n=1 Tax=Pararge aegeria aegeria TaxID=348720 RepID=A0A8S4R0S4_9NEOP|nr:jg20114 [Pararge aegeria aegeria]